MKDPDWCDCGYQFRFKYVRKVQKSNGWIAKVWMGQHFIRIPHHARSYREYCLVSKNLELNKKFIVHLDKKSAVDKRERANLDKHFFWEHFEDQLSSEDEEYWRSGGLPFKRVFLAKKVDQPAECEPEDEPEPIL